MGDRSLWMDKFAVHLDDHLRALIDVILFFSPSFVKITAVVGALSE